MIAKPESRLNDRLGIPDFAAVADGALCGYVELKAPGEGADATRYRGRNKEQWERFRSLPNVVYTDGNEWCLYQNAEAADALLRFRKDIRTHGAAAVTDADADRFATIAAKFLAWSPVIPKNSKDQAVLLAPLCRLLRGDVAEALRDPDSPLHPLAADWRALLFPEADDERFADAYAQTVTFALLLARSEGADVSTPSGAVDGLSAGHTLLSRALQVLTDARSRVEIEPSLRLLRRVVNAFPPAAARPAAGDDPWLFFYEHFLAEYDPRLRKDSGVYYTPVEVVRCQVALVDELLRDELGKPGGFADAGVVTLDPAVGTGTYLLGVIDHALTRVADEQGPGMVPARARTLAANLYGLEIMVGPYAVAELRLTRALQDRGATAAATGLGVYLADTLESPNGRPPALPAFFEPIAEQHRKALELKARTSVIVCLGNPPYDRHEAVGAETRGDRARTGGWVRWGDAANPDAAILNDFVTPARDAGHGGDIKNLYNLYVYFWRWALWKVFEHAPAGAAGVVSFITPASYLRGDAFVGLRDLLRRLCHEVWVIDLGGEGRGTRRDENVFNIQTPVAVCVAVRTGAKDRDKPARVRYVRLRGTRDDKLKKLSAVEGFRSLPWKTCPKEWHAPFRPKGTGAYFRHPKLTDLMPWVATGIETKRPWVYAPDINTLARRWKALLRSVDPSRAFVETRDRKLTGKYPLIAGFDFPGRSQKPVGNEKPGTTFPGYRGVAYRAYGRAIIIADNRLSDYVRTGLWYSFGIRQVYFSTLATQPLGPGPALVASALVPDRHFFRGSFGGKNTIPLYRDAAGREPNILPGLRELWGGGSGGASRPRTSRRMCTRCSAPRRSSSGSTTNSKTATSASRSRSTPASSTGPSPPAAGSCSSTLTANGTRRRACGRGTSPAGPPAARSRSVTRRPTTRTDSGMTPPAGRSASARGPSPPSPRRSGSTRSPACGWSIRGSGIG